MSHVAVVGRNPAGRVLGNAGVLFVASLLSRTLRLAVFIVVARHLGLAEYGALAFVVAYVEIFRTVADFGIDTMLVRRLAISGETGRLVGSAAVLKGLLGLTAYALGLGGAVIAGYPHSRVRLLAVGLIGLFLSSGSNLFAAPFQSLLQTHRIVWTGMAGTGIYILLTAAGVWTGQGVLYFIMAGLVAELLGFSLALAVLTDHARPRWGGWRQTWLLLRDSLPIGVTTVIVIAYWRLGLLLLDRTHEPVEVGMYAISLRIVEVILLLAGAIAGSAFAAMARMFGQTQLSAVNTLYQMLYQQIIAGVTVIALLLTFLGPVLLRFIGSEFVTASNTLSTLLWAAVFIFANQMSSALLMAAGLGSSIAMVAAWNLCLNAALSILLIPRFGAVGAAAALVLTEAVNVLAQTLLVWNRFGIVPPLGLWLRVSAAAAVVYLLREVPGLVPLILTLFIATAVWQKDLSIRWMLNASGALGRQAG